MTFQRRLIRVLLVAAGLVAVAVAIVALREEGGRTPAVWATLAAVLAVMAAAISAWTSQRLVELQEDAMRPVLMVTLDARSRYQLVQLRLFNRGQSPAYKVRLKWASPPRDLFKNRSVDMDLPVLNPGENASLALGVSHEFFKQHAGATFRGELKFETASGEERAEPVVVSGEHERYSLVHDDEQPKTLFELQKLPSKLDAIATEIRKLHDQDVKS